MGWDEEYVGKRVMGTDVERRREGRQKLRWKDSMNVDLRAKGLSGEQTHNRAVWSQLVTYIDSALKRCGGRRRI